MTLIPNTHRFTHEAMGTIFDVDICCRDADYARSASIEAYRLLDTLEQYLSRYIPNSDISRINNLKIGEWTRVSFETFECLMQCVELYELSKGAFDITIGALYQIWLDEDKNLRSPSSVEIKRARDKVGMYHLAFDEEQFRVGKTGGPVRLDLGGFGKGYALDKMAELLREWDIESFWLNGGQSSMLFGTAPDGKEGWPITISDPFNEYKQIREFVLSDRAISGSGLIKGQHIIDPRNGRPVPTTRAAWAFAPTAAAADGLSTTFMILSNAEIKDLCEQIPSKALILIKSDESAESELLYMGSDYP